MTDPTVAAVKAALRDNMETVIDEVATSIIVLGAKPEWDMEDNFLTTEGIARLAADSGLPSAGDQSDEDLAFWREVAVAAGLFDPTDFDDVIGGPL